MYSVWEGNSKKPYIPTITKKVVQGSDTSGSILFVVFFTQEHTVKHQSFSIFGDLPNDLWTAFFCRDMIKLRELT
jgi:hypothetical protein